MAVWRYGPVWTGPYLSQGLLMKSLLAASKWNGTTRRRIPLAVSYVCWLVSM